MSGGATFEADRKRANIAQLRDAIESLNALVIRTAPAAAERARAATGATGPAIAGGVGSGSSGKGIADVVASVRAEVAEREGKTVSPSPAPRVELPPDRLEQWVQWRERWLEFYRGTMGVGGLLGADVDATTARYHREGAAFSESFAALDPPAWPSAPAPSDSHHSTAAVAAAGVVLAGGAALLLHYRYAARRLHSRGALGSLAARLDAERQQRVNAHLDRLEAERQQRAKAQLDRINRRGPHGS